MLSRIMPLISEVHLTELHLGANQSTCHPGNRESFSAVEDDAVGFSIGHNLGNFVWCVKFKCVIVWPWW